MSTPLHSFITGSFTSAGVAVNLSLPAGYQDFRLINITDIGSSAANTNVMRAEGTSLMPAGSAYLNLKTNGAATLQLESMITSGGFTFVDDSASAPLSAAVAITGITNATPPVVSTASTAGLSNSDVVRITNSTGQLNIAGMDFTIGALIANTSFSLAFMTAPGAAGTAGFWRRVPFDPRYYPVRRFITNISAASQAIVTMSVTHGFTVGQDVRLIVPSGFGMVQANGLLGRIVAIGAADANGFTNTITVDIDTSSFTAFAFPSSAVAALGVTFPQVVPVGEAAVGSVANSLDDATRNVSFRGVIIGTGVQSSGSLYQWFATRGVAI